MIIPTPTTRYGSATTRYGAVAGKSSPGNWRLEGVTERERSGGGRPVSAPGGAERRRPAHDHRQARVALTLDQARKAYETGRQFPSLLTLFKLRAALGFSC